MAFSNDLLTTNFELDINCFTQQSPICVTPVLQSLLLTFCTRNSTRILLRLPHYQILFFCLPITVYVLTFLIITLLLHVYVCSFPFFCFVLHRSAFAVRLDFLLCSYVCFFVSFSFFNTFDERYIVLTTGKRQSSLSQVPSDRIQP